MLPSSARGSFTDCKVHLDPFFLTSALWSGQQQSRRLQRRRKSDAPTQMKDTAGEFYAPLFPLSSKIARVVFSVAPVNSVGSAPAGLRHIVANVIDAARAHTSIGDR